MAGPSIATVTNAQTILAIFALRTDLVTEDATPARSTVTLARLRVTRRSVSTATLVAAVLAVPALLALLIAQLSQPAGAAGAGAVLWLAVGIIPAGAHFLTGSPEGVDGAGAVTVTSRESRLTEALTGPRVTSEEVR